ncbi:MAG: hypothetical protein RR614_11240, partial [Eubacterium sp.]
MKCYKKSFRVIKVVSLTTKESTCYNATIEAWESGSCERRKNLDKKHTNRFGKIGLKALTLGMVMTLTAFVGTSVLAAPTIPVDSSGIENYEGGRIPAGYDASY